MIGLSGGIDSALTAVVAADALGAENIFGVAMPSRYSSEGSIDDAAALAKNLGIHFQTLPIEKPPSWRSQETRRIFQKARLKALADAKYSEPASAER